MEKTISKKFSIEELKRFFQAWEIIYAADLLSYFKKFEPRVTKTTVNWRIHNLIQKGILKRIGRGKFKLGKEKVFIPDIPEKIRKINKSLSKSFPFLVKCLWTTSVYNEFMVHQQGRFYLLVEVERDATEAVFHFMKEQKYSVYLEPSRELIHRYISGEKETWIVKSLVSEAPTQIVSGVNTATIEKMLVDIFCDPVTFDAQQGSEMEVIFRESFEKYTVNENKMLRYADRRRKKNELNNYLNKISKYRQHT